MMKENEDWEYYGMVIDNICQSLVTRNKIRIEYGKKVTVDDYTKETNVINGLFPSGLIVTTASVNNWITAGDNPARVDFRRKYVQLLLLRHFSGDWGIQCLEDYQANEDSLREGMRIMSVYPFPDDTHAINETLWIITEADRSVTTVLFPADY